MKKSDRCIYLLTQSLGYYLLNEPLLIGSTSKVLTAWYASPLLSIKYEFPDLETIQLPTLAVAHDRKGGNERYLYGKYVARDYIYNIWGFSGGETNDIKNKVQREKLISDVSALLDDGTFVIYDWSDLGVKGTNRGTANIKSYTHSKLGHTGTSQADKYRFLFTVTLDTMQDIS
jgi:hypothetical protein